MCMLEMQRTAASCILSKACSRHFTEYWEKSKESHRNRLVQILELKTIIWAHVKGNSKNLSTIYIKQSPKQKSLGSWYETREMWGTQKVTQMDCNFFLSHTLVTGSWHYHLATLILLHVASSHSLHFLPASHLRAAGLLTRQLASLEYKAEADRFLFFVFCFVFLKS